MLSFGRCSSCSRHSESTSELNVHWCKANFLHYASLPDSKAPYIVTFLPSRVVQSAVVKRLDMDGNGATHALMHLRKKSKNLSCWPLQKAPDCQFQPVDSCSQLRLLTLDICWHLCLCLDCGYRISCWTGLTRDIWGTKSVLAKGFILGQDRTLSACDHGAEVSIEVHCLWLRAVQCKVCGSGRRNKNNKKIRYVFHFSWNIYIVCNVT